MREGPQPERHSRAFASARVGERASAARAAGSIHPPIQPLDRSYLLRRGREFPFPELLGDPNLIRLRRERRVSASFRAIPPLTRDGR